MQVAPLDEPALRRPANPAFAPSPLSVVLSDGQPWTLFKPRPVWVAAGNADGYVVEWEPEGYADASKALDEGIAAGDDAAIIRSEMTLFRLLLLRNYDLADGDLARLLRIDYGADPTPENVAMRRALLAAVFGRAADDLVEVQPEPDAIAS